MKLGLDIHGVIMANPKFYSKLSYLALQKNYEVHIITGSMLTEKKIQELKKYKMYWTHLFSITDYHKNLGTPMTFTDPNNPWIDNLLWDKTKAEYCEKENIDFHIDDTIRYGEYFKTIFAHYDYENNRLDWHFLTKRHHAFLLTTPKDVLNFIEDIVRKET